MAGPLLFICYSTRDGARFARRLVDALERGSPPFDTYLDSRNLRAGQHWDAQLELAIRDCASLLFVVTKDSVRDDSVCKEEWTYAREQGKRVIPLLFDAAVPAPFGLRTVQHINFTGDFDAAMARLRADLTGDPPPADTPSSEWRLWWLPAVAGGAALLVLLALGVAFLHPAGILVGPAVTPSPSQAAGACPASRPCSYQVQLAGRPCLERTADGMVDNRPCDGSASQQWIEDHAGRQFTLRDVADNLCIVAGALGEPLAMGDCSARAAMWTANAHNDRSYTFRNVVQTGGCITGDGIEGGPVLLQRCDGAAHQSWS